MTPTAAKQRSRNLERRSATRYKLQLPVIFHWNDSQAHTEGGFTYDVAQDGVLIRSKICPPVGSAVRVEVLLPAVNPGSVGMRVQCIGEVTRVINQEGVMSFGVEGDFDDAHLTRETEQIEIEDFTVRHRVQ